jgi:hypothetical protein
MLNFFTIKQLEKPMFLLTLLTVGLVTAPLGSGSETHFSRSVPHGSGAANVAPANGGEYVYGGGTADARTKSAALLVGKPLRTDFSFISPAEEEAFVRMLGDRRAAEVRGALNLARAKVAAKRKELVWPKVVLRGNEICVPELASSESVEWKEHLTCYRGKESENGKP